jgi:hypothetical protein
VKPVAGLGDCCNTGIACARTGCAALISSFPIRSRGGKWEIAQGLPINDFSRAKIDVSVAELKEEKSLVSDLIS